MKESELLAIAQLIIPKAVEAQNDKSLFVPLRTASLKLEIALREIEILIMQKNK